MRRWLPPALVLLGLACDRSSDPADAEGKGKAVAPAETKVVPVPPPEATPSCNTDEITALVQALGRADPRAHAEVVSRGLADACQMPPFLVHYFELAHQPGPLRSPVAPGDRASYRAVLEQACPDAKASVTAAPGSDSTAAIFEACKLDRFELWPSERYLARHPSSLMPFAAYQWLIEQEVEEPAAKTIAQAVEVFDRRELGSVRARPGLEVPRLAPPLEPVPAGPRIDVSRAQLRLLDETFATLDDGRLPPDDAAALAEAFIELAKTDRALVESRNEHWQGRLLVVADTETPSRTLMDVLHAATKAGFVRPALAADGGVFEWGAVPLAAPSAEPSDAPSLTVHVDPAGFEVSSGAGAPERLGVRAASGHDAWDYEALAERARARDAAPPEERTALLRVDGDTPVGVVARAATAVRGCKAEGDCPIPDVVVTASPTE